MSALWLALAVGCVYILSAKMSLALLTPDGVAVFWPAAGIAAGTLIAAGPSARWAVAAGTLGATIVANVLGDRNLALHPEDFSDMGNATRAVAQALRLDNHVDGGADHLANGFRRQGESSHQDHGF